MVSFEISGEFTIEQSENIKKLFIENLDKFNAFEVKVKETESFDLSALQLLIAFKKKVEKENKQLHLKMVLPDNIKELSERSGLLDYIK